MKENFQAENSRINCQEQNESEIKNILQSEINQKSNFLSKNKSHENENQTNLADNTFNSKNRNANNNNKSNNIIENINNNNENSKQINSSFKNSLSEFQINSQTKIIGNQTTASKFQASNKPKLVRTRTSGIMFFGEKGETPKDPNAVEERKLNSISESQQKLYENVNTNNLNLNNNYFDDKIIENNNTKNNINKYEHKNLNSNENNDNNNDNNEDAQIKHGVQNNTAKAIPFDENNVVTRKRSTKKIISELLDKNITALIMSIATIYALILSDLNIIFFSPDIDILFNILSGLVFLLFLVEFVLSTTTKEDYNGTFFFWLDLLSIFSMILNIDWIIYPFLEFFSETTNSDSTVGNLDIQKVVRNLSGVIRLTRVTRLLRIIRIIRLIRLLKLYKNVMIAKKNMELKKAQERMRIRKLEEMKQKIVLTDESSNAVDSKEEENEIIFNRIQNKSNLVLSNRSAKKRRLSTRSDSNKKREELSETPYEDILSESKISEKLSSSMTKLIISLIMLLLLTFPYMSNELYSDSDLTNYSILLKYMENYFGLNGELTPEMNFTFFNLLNRSFDENYPIINITYNNSLIWENEDLKNENFRYDEVNYFYDDNGLSLISYGTQFDNKLSSILNIARTVYVAVILGWMIVKLDEDSKTHALYPLENIMSIIQTISRDPIGSRNTQRLHGKASKNVLSAVELKELNRNAVADKPAIKDNKNIDYGEAEKNEEEKQTRQKALDKKERNKLKSKSNYEVKIIEAAVIKISALLAIGFGEAGEAIIKHNLKPGTQEVNPMVKGRKKIAIFGFCDIRQFPVVNECLQERTMSFVNQISNIVHTSVDLFMGAANKNIGDAFLCVWKFRNSKKKQSYSNNNNNNNENNNNDNINDNGNNNQISYSEGLNGNEDRSVSISKINIKNNNNTMILEKNNFLKKTNTLENCNKFLNKDKCEIDDDRSFNNVTENKNAFEDIKNHNFNQIQSFSDTNICKSQIEKKKFNQANNKINSNCVDNKINTNNKEKNINVNNNASTTSPNNNNNKNNNNNINYNININVLSIPNNNIKININNTNFINNPTANSNNYAASSLAADNFNPNNKDQTNKIAFINNNNKNISKKQLTNPLSGSIAQSNSPSANKLENQTILTEQENYSINKLLNNNNNKNNNNPNNNDNNKNLITNANTQLAPAAQGNIKPKILISKANDKHTINQTEAADRALLGYLHIIKCINKRPNILVYRTDTDILNSIPNYKVKMGFGLHIGWAIEGAIGSHHKIDASYLSPNVNMSARLEAATKQYGVSILISGDLYDSLSAELKEICRLIDVVTVKGSNKPIKFYTCDLNLDLKPSEKDQPNINLSENRKIYEEKKERFYEAIEASGGSIGKFMKSKSSFRELLDVKRPSVFKKVFANAINNYIKGDWDKARKYLNKALELDPNDGPGKTIFDYLSKFDFKAPLTWKGFRELNSK